VHDTGRGIPPEHHAAIFREFHRLDARASASEGMGLGLAIVERACALLDHDLRLRSAPGHGSCFMVTLRTAKSGGERDLGGRVGRERRIAPDDRVALIVENDVEMARALTLILEKWGIRVVNASSGKEALQRLLGQGIAPDFALVDYQLDSEKSGVEVIEDLRLFRPGLATRLITASRSPELSDLCRTRQIEVIHKPVSIEDLSAFVGVANPTPARPRLAADGPVRAVTEHDT
jgi:CheY-like chemotaxis protein